MQEARALLLDKNYIAISVVPWKKAVKLVVKGKAEVVHNSADSIPFGRGRFPIPSVIRLLEPIPWKAHVVRVRFTRKNIIIRDDSNCQYCGQKVSKSAITIDHIIPRSRGGESNFTNCVVSCMRCNSIKADKTLAEAELKLLNRPRQPSFYTFYRNYLKGAPEEWKIYVMGKDGEN